MLPTEDYIKQERKIKVEDIKAEDIKLEDIKLEKDYNRFIADEVSFTIQKAIEATIGGQTYNHSKVGDWSNKIVQHCIDTLTRTNDHFKYIVTCIVLQKTGAGLHAASCCHWDNETDGSCTVRWENKTMYVVVSVFGLLSY